MQKIIYLLLFVFSSIWSLEIDTSYLKKRIENDPANIQDRLILAKYFLQNNDYNQSNLYIHEIYAISPNNEKAKALDRKIRNLRKIQKSLPKTELSNPFSIEKALTAYKQNKQCEHFIKAYELLQDFHISVTDKTALDAAHCYLREGQIYKSKLLIHIKEFPPSPDLSALEALVSLQENDLQKANRLYTQMQQKYPDHAATQEVFKAIQTKAVQKTQIAAKTLNQTNSLSALKDYIYLLSKQEKQKNAIKAVKSFISKNPHNTEAKVLLVKLYYWNGNLDKAFHTIYPVRLTNFETKKLYANILYEKGDYQHALVYLPDAAKKTKDPKERYNLQKRVAFAYAYRGFSEKANRIFKKLLKQNPHDLEIIQFQKAYKQQTMLQKAGKLQSQKKYDEALKLYKKYYQQHKDPKIAKEIAEIYYFTKKYQNALPYFKAYLATQPKDHLIRFHYASALEKLKLYKKSANHFSRIQNPKDQELGYLAQYHYSYCLMQTQEEQDWLTARKTLQNLSHKLSLAPENRYKELKRYVNSLYKLVQKEIRKPTYFKDIVLTEGATKQIDVQTVFSNLNIISTTKPSLKTLLHIETQPQHHKPHLEFTLDYASDSQMLYRNYQIMVANLLTINGIRYSASTQKYLFNFQNKKQQKGKGFYLSAKRKNLTLSLGVEQFSTFNTLVPKITWSKLYGAHNLFMDIYYQNGVFTNYRSCMIENQTKVFHAGIYDRILLENLNFAELGISLNAYDDGNINLYAMAEYPFYTTTVWGIDHTFAINENIDYNSKTAVCYQPSELYDSTYLKYKPKVDFSDGSLEISMGSGYSFKNKEQVYSYAVKGDYTINHTATFEINCERLQSSFTSDDIDYCTLNIIQGW